MLEHAANNLMRLLAAEGLTVEDLVARTGLDRRTVRGILQGTHQPRPQTLRRLADGLGVAVEELFVDPARLVYRRFDRTTNPMVAQVIDDHPDLFSGWREADFDELHSHMGTGGPLTYEGALEIAGRMNRKHELHDKLDLLLETSHAELVAEMLDLLYRKALVEE